MTAATVKKMHQDHRQWRSEDDFWRDELRVWQQETQAALADIKKLEKALLTHQEHMAAHAASVRLNEQMPVAHEHVLKLQEQGVSGRCLAPTEELHSREADKQIALRHTHEQLKRRHHRLLALWTVLLREVEAE